MARFNHAVSAYTKVWFEVDEKWLQKYMKPQLLHDMYFLAKPLKRVPVALTGKVAAQAKVLNCVKQVEVSSIHSSPVSFVRHYPCIAGGYAFDSQRRRPCFDCSFELG